jgi:hypothetical protein
LLVSNAPASAAATACVKRIQDQKFHADLNPIFTSGEALSPLAGWLLIETISRHCEGAYPDECNALVRVPVGKDDRPFPLRVISLPLCGFRLKAARQ